MIKRFTLLMLFGNESTNICLDLWLNTNHCNKIKFPALSCGTVDCPELIQLWERKFYLLIHKLDYHLLMNNLDIYPTWPSTHLCTTTGRLPTYVPQLDVYPLMYHNWTSILNWKNSVIPIIFKRNTCPV